MYFYLLHNEIGLVDRIEPGGVGLGWNRNDQLLSKGIRVMGVVPNNSWGGRSGLAAIVFRVKCVHTGFHQRRGDTSGAGVLHGHGRGVRTGIHLLGRRCLGLRRRCTVRGWGTSHYFRGGGVDLHLVDPHGNIVQHSSELVLSMGEGTCALEGAQLAVHESAAHLRLESLGVDLSSGGEVGGIFLSLGHLRMRALVLLARDFFQRCRSNHFVDFVVSNVKK